MASRACKFLLEADEYFNNGIVDEDKFKKNTELHSYCPYDNGKRRPCKNNYERINALGVHLYQKLNKTTKNLNGTGHHENRHIEFFMIWLGDKLFKLEKNYKTTMEESYKKYLDNHIGNYKYWNVINSKRLYKDATIRKMNELYNLLSYICKLITEYNKNPKKPNRDTLGNYSAQCRNYYKTTHNAVKSCKPYLHLLDSLKRIYEDFRWEKIINNNDSNINRLLSNRIESLKTFGNEDHYFVSDSEELSFNNEGCGKVKLEDEELGKKIASKDSQGKQKDPTKPNKPPTGIQTPHSGNSPRGTNGQSGKSPITGKPSLGSQPQSAATKPATPKLPAPKLPPSPQKPAPAKPAPAKPATTKQTSSGPKPAAPASASGPSRNVKQVSGDSPAKKPVHTPPGPVQGQAQIPRKPDPAKPGAIIPGAPSPPKLGGTPPAKPAVPPPPAPPPAPPQGSQKLGAIPQSGAKGSDKGSDASKSDTTGSGIQKGKLDSGGGGKGALNADTGGTSGGSKNQGGKPIGDIQKKPGHVDTSTPGSQASSQGMGPGNQRDAGGTSPSSIDSGKGNTTDNTSTGDNGKKDSNGVTVSKGTTANNKGDQLQGTDHTQGSSSSVTGGSAIGPGVGTGGAAGGASSQVSTNVGKGGSPDGSGGSGNAQGSLSGGPGNPGGDPGVTSSGASGGKVGGADSGASTGSVSAQSDQGVPSGGSVPPGNGQGDANSMQGVGKAGKDTQAGGNSNMQGGVSVNKGGADANTGVSDSGSSGGKIGDPGSGQGGSNGGAGGPGSKSGSGKGGANGNAGDGTGGTDGGLGTPNPVSPPGDPSGVSMTSGSGTKPPGSSYSYWSNFWGTRLSPTKYLPSLSDMYETQRNILAKATNQVSDAYNKTMTIAQNAYGSTVDIAKNAYGSTVDIARNAYGSAVTNIKSALTTSSNYIGNAVGSVTSKLNPFSSSSQPSGDQSGSNSLGDGTDTSNQPQPGPPPPLSPPQSTLPLPPVTSTSPGTQTPSSHQKPTSTQVSQNTVQKGASNIVQQLDPNAGKGGIQTLTITQATLPSSGISPSNIGSGNKTSGIDVKINEKPSIWCIAQNKKCDIVGIGIIGISISIFLAIMYKYLSFGSAKNSKKEKSMKRVINSTSGKKQIQIIINSSTKKKQTKKYIKPVYRGKPPLLNIYKLMQADPMPFINLFFLLIFFVYKRKRDTIE
ncbi:CIR protein [Plasmodium chabaudi chabaudi]|uniref:PIR protein n=1 Tax=Plasmodium chabaudi chabaudi TaxID=31271 RepID=A0A4V0KFT4_PLACU|nr:CIR protein [Plasmodium chabaudi chabaudi]VTZ71359.1 CIR protein [Plasmodium chabaudi chabaudi]|eukprot:XP_016655114.1 CIR protein [Plasmodium chabaudi chabaudi]